MQHQLTLDDALARATDPPAALHPRTIPDPRDNVKAADPARLTADQELVLRCHDKYWQAGLTDFQLAEHLQRQQTSVGKRRIELERAGLIKYWGIRRPTGNGGTAGVYRITAAGEDVVRRLERER